MLLMLIEKKIWDKEKEKRFWHTIKKWLEPSKKHRYFIKQ